MAKITLLPNNEVVEVAEGDSTSLLELLKNHGLYVKSSCGGHASCSDCVIKVRSGESNLTEPTFEEINLLGNVFHITKERLSCQTKVLGDVTIDVSGHDKMTDQEKIRQKTASVHSKTVLRRTAKEKDQIIEERKAAAAERREGKYDADGNRIKDGGFNRPKDPFKK
jgi:2Fe-2S ferredoxin